MNKKRKYKLPETLRVLMYKHPHSGEKTTQKELARYIGIRPQTVSQYLSSESIPPANKCLAIADYFGVSADYLLVGYKDRDLYFLMADAHQRRLCDKLSKIAVLCSNAENIALGLMESEVAPDV